MPLVFLVILCDWFRNPRHSLDYLVGCKAKVKPVLGTRVLPRLEQVPYFHFQSLSF